MAFDPSYADAIARIESGGRYDLLGPVTKSGDRAYGKYQVMGNNVGPWTKEALGQELTPEQFVASPEAQDAVFQAQFGKYVDKYGPEGAAQAWFGGPGAVGKTDRKDQLGTSVGSYGKQFMASLGQPSAPPQPIEPQKPIAPQPLDLAQSLSPTQMAQAPQSFQLPAFGFSPQAAPQQPAPSFDLPIAPPLNAPPAVQDAVRQLNLAKAFQKIPLPPGFRGFVLRG